jgi:hypothetical protein
MGSLTAKMSELENKRKKALNQTFRFIAVNLKNIYIQAETEARILTR